MKILVFFFFLVWNFLISMSVSCSACNYENGFVFYKQGVQIQNLEIELERVNEECQGLRLSQAELTENLKESQSQVGR